MSQTPSPLFDQAPLFDQVGIIGLGLIGSSLARAIKARGIARQIIAMDQDEAVIARVRELGLADACFTKMQEGVRGCDLVILCVPVRANRDVVEQIAPFLQAGAMLSDVGSVKGAVVRDITPLLPASIAFVPAHPVAGTEYSGPDAGFAELFVNRWAILTPIPSFSPQEAVEKMTAFWQALGSMVEIMTPEHHDLVLAITSHVPHLIAYNIVGTADDLETVTQGEVIKFSAGGFRDFTRIASSDPTMWRDVFLTNKDAVLEMLGRFNEDLAALQRAIRWGDGEHLHALFTRTRAIRRNIIALGQETPAPDFGRSDHQKP